jgi:DNA-binding beta-propeller fold protein YncE
LITAGTAIAASGALTPTGCIADSSSNPDSCAKTTKGLSGPQAVAVSPDGRSVYAATGASNAVVTFKRNQKSGALKPAGCIAEKGSNPDGCSKTTAGLNNADAVTVSPDGRSVYVGSYNSNALVRFNRNKNTGALTPAGCIGDAGHNPSHCKKTTKGLTQAESIVVSPNGKWVYEGGGGGIVVFKRSGTGAVKPTGCIGARGANFEHCQHTARGLEGDVSIALTPDASSLYATSSYDNGVVTFSRDAKSGALKAQGCIAWSGGNPASCPKTTGELWYPFGIAVSPGGGSVYVTTLNSGSLLAFTRNTKTGKLTVKDCFGASGCGASTTGLAGAFSVAVSSDGKAVYTAATHDNAVDIFARRNNGGLHPDGCWTDGLAPSACPSTTLGLRWADGIAVSPDSKSVYAVGANSNAIVTFKRGSP